MSPLEKIAIDANIPHNLGFSRILPMTEVLAAEENSNSCKGMTLSTLISEPKKSLRETVCCVLKQLESLTMVQQYTRKGV